MKNVICAMMTILAVCSAKAVSASDTWETILAANDYQVDNDYPNFGPQGIFNMCATATELRSISDVTVCTQTDYVPPKHHNDSGSTICVATQQVAVAIPRVSEVTFCRQYQNSKNEDTCLEYGTMTYEVSMTQQEIVRKLTSSNSQGTFFKPYTIPACK